MNKVQLFRHIIGPHNFDAFYEHLLQEPDLYIISNNSIQSIT